MDIAQALAVIDELCARAFPARRTAAGAVGSGPGYWTAEWGVGRDLRQADAADREQARTQYEADRDALGERLTARWGPPQRFGLYSLFERAVRGEALAEPWGLLGGHVPDVQLWRSDRAGRWIALGVTHEDGGLPQALVAVVTDVDPP
ncbi:hypothetical protein [Streptomyces tropicalis]|uniref:Uncharacterized protein n=1 Tax=Streptomyces tropicalis TaxID=3034234 RepID=A0ABT6A544_9ACTN|nr:hypothetical protein [Streptomyces tropicalis]MDF3299583.1 hypothetical protein [Streptomyces tropicalis]